MNLGEVPESPDPECRKCFDGEDVQEKAPSDVGKVSVDPVEVDLAETILLAGKAKQWTTVEILSRELSARRLARTSPDVATLEARRKKDAP